eukprot:scaffold3621_cov114-Cylindrotheca_fusiformis.AAC.11
MMPLRRDFVLSAQFVGCTVVDITVLFYWKPMVFDRSILVPDAGKQTHSIIVLASRFVVH